jgi:hypothetical protein
MLLINLLTIQSRKLAHYIVCTGNAAEGLVKERTDNEEHGAKPSKEGLYDR